MHQVWKTLTNKYTQTYWVKNGNISCTCIHGSMFPLNFIQGEKVCRHLKKFIRELYDRKVYKPIKHINEYGKNKGI